MKSFYIFLMVILAIVILPAVLTMAGCTETIFVKKQVENASSNKTEMAEAFPMELSYYLDKGIPASSAEKIIQVIKDIKNNPNDVKKIVYLGNLYYDNNLPNYAIKAYEKSLKISPKDSSALADLGVMYRRIGQSKKSIQCFDEAISINPKQESAYFNKGVVLFFDMHDKDGAISAWKELISIDPLARSSDGRLVTDLIKSIR